MLLSWSSGEKGGWHEPQKRRFGDDDGVIVAAGGLVDRISTP